MRRFEHTRAKPARTPRVEYFAGGARCSRGALAPRELWISTWPGDAAARRAAELLAAGRKVRFRVVIRSDGHTLEAHDADPWAAGWRAYGIRRAWQRWGALAVIPAAAMLTVIWLVLRNKLPSTINKEPAP